MTKDQRYAWEERAAIREFCGGEDRETAEKAAWLSVFGPKVPFPGTGEQQRTLFKDI